MAAHDARPVRVGVQAGVLRLTADSSRVEQNLQPQAVPRVKSVGMHSNHSLAGHECCAVALSYFYNPCIYKHASREAVLNFNKRH